MSHNSHQITAVKKASREAAKTFNGTTRVVPVIKTKHQRKLTTKELLREVA